MRVFNRGACFGVGLWAGRSLPALPELVKRRKECTGRSKAQEALLEAGRPERLSSALRGHRVVPRTARRSAILASGASLPPCGRALARTVSQGSFRSSCGHRTNDGRSRADTREGTTNERLITVRE